MNWYKAPSRWQRKETRLRLSSLHEGFIQRVLERLQPDGDLFGSPIGEGEALPTCSADYGTAGIAYSLLRLSSCRRDDPELLTLADLWITKTLSQANKDSSFYNAKLELTRETVTPVSLHHMINGVFFVKALVSQALGDSMGQQVAMDAFVGASREGDGEPGLDPRPLQRPAWMVVIGRKREGCALSGPRPADRIRRRVDERIWNQMETFAPIKESTDISYLGMAHGWAGSLYAALRWCQVRAAVTGEDASAALPADLPGGCRSSVSGDYRLDAV